MADVLITVGTFAFRARFERDAAPLTCARFESMLPYRERLIHVRWSGEACWIPLGGLDLGLGYESATSYPAPGQLLFHPGGISETEILLAYGGVPPDEIERMLAEHRLYLETEYHQGHRANFSSADLTGRDFSGR
jgi:hypothetical protein